MNEVDFRQWQINIGVSQKVQSDTISRIKKIERTVGCEIDEQFHQDKCKTLLRIFANAGRNPEMEKHLPNDLPIGKYYLSAYKLAISKYIMYMESLTSEKQ